MCEPQFENVWAGALSKLSVLCYNVLKQLVSQNREWPGFSVLGLSPGVQRRGAVLRNPC